MSRSAAVLASLLATLGRPAWWPLALAAFLLRGGFALFLVPIVFLPSVLALSVLVAPWIMSLAFGRIDAEVVAVIGGGLVVFLAWLVGGGWIAAAMDVALIRLAADAAAEEGIGPVTATLSGSGANRRRRDRAIINRVLVARLLAAIPLGIAVAIGIARIVAVTYIELTQPADPSVPLVARVLAGATGELALIAAAWAFGEVVGGVAARRIVLGRATVARAVRGAVSDVLRQPLSTIVPWLVTTAFGATMLAATLGAARIAWSRTVVLIAGDTSEATVLALALLIFVAIWLAGLLLAGAFAALRSTVQTFEEVRRTVPTAAGSGTETAESGGDQPGTFGASAHHRPGDWSMRDEGGSL